MIKLFMVPPTVFYADSIIAVALTLFGTIRGISLKSYEFSGRINSPVSLLTKILGSIIERKN